MHSLRWGSRATCYKGLLKVALTGSGIISGLNVGCLQEEVISLFSTFGEVVNVEVKRDRNSGNNLGYGFVEFLNREYAKAAIQSQDDLQLRGRQLRLGWAHKSTSLFVR